MLETTENTATVHWADLEWNVEFILLQRDAKTSNGVCRRWHA